MQTFCDLLTKCLRRKSPAQDNLRVEEAEVRKTFNESRLFQAKWLKEHTWLRYESQAMFCHFCRLGKKKNPSQVMRAVQILKQHL